MRAAHIHERADGGPQIAFTTHALERFAGRAGLEVGDRATVQAILEELVRNEGRIVRRRPSWARSRNQADLYIQLGEWMLLPAQRDLTRAPDAYAVVTAINGDARMTWTQARRLGCIRSDPPAGLLAPRRGLFWRLARLLRG